MPRFRSLSAILLLVGSIPLLHAADPLGLPRSTPEAQGVSSAGVLAFVEAADRVDAMHSVMVVRHGRVIAEGWWTPYAADSPHELYSLSKSFTSTAVGFAVAEGKLGVDDPVLKFFPDDAPAEPGANLKAMRVRDLLSMVTGHQDEPPTGPAAVSAKSFLAQPVPHKPGTHFKYNTAATFMLSAIVQKVTGQTALEYLRPRLFEPLGIAGATWSTNFQGIPLGGYGLKVRTEDIAKLGQLYLQKGQWQGRQLLPVDWVEAATSRQTSNGSNPNSDWDQGYGYQFWRCRHGGYRGDGAFGQYCIVLPEQDTVVAITSGVKDMQVVLNVVWDTLLPALQPGRLAENPAAQKQLTERLAGLSVRTPDGAATSPIIPKIANKVFKFPQNEQGLESITFKPAVAGKGFTLVSRVRGADSRLDCGFREWTRSRGDFGSGLMGLYPDEALAASAAWPGDDTLVVKICATETPFHATLRLRFDGDTLIRDREVNVGFGGTKQPQLVGRIE